MVKDGELFLNNTVVEISHLMENNFDEAIVDFNRTLQETADKFTLLVKDIKDITNITTIIDTAQHFLTFTTDVYREIIKSVLEIKTTGTDIQNDITDINESCGISGCSDIATQLSVISEAIGTVLSVLSGIDEKADIPEEVSNTMKEFSQNLGEISQTIDSLSDNFIENYFVDINKEIANIGATLRKEKDNIVNITESLNIFSEASGAIDDLDQQLTEFYSYFYFSLIAFGSLLVLILLLLLIGLVLGCCSTPGSGLASKTSTIFKITIGIFLGRGLYVMWTGNNIYPPFPFEKITF